MVGRSVVMKLRGERAVKVGSDEVRCAVVVLRNGLGFALLMVGKTYALSRVWVRSWSLVVVVESWWTETSWCWWMSAWKKFPVRLVILMLRLVKERMVVPLGAGTVLGNRDVKVVGIESLGY